MTGGSGSKDDGTGFEIELMDARTGKLTVYRRIEDIPAELRSKVEPFLTKGGASSSVAPVTFRDASGDQVGFSSESEMPDDVRRLYDTARKAKRDGSGKQSEPVSGHKVVIWKTRRPERLAGAHPETRGGMFYATVVVAVALAGVLVALWIRSHR